MPDADLTWQQRVARQVRTTTAVAIASGILTGFVAAALAYVAVGHRQPSYLATTATLLDEPRAIASAQDAGIVDKLSRLRFKYAGLLRSDTVVSAVAQRTGLPRGLVAGSVVSRGDTASLLLYIGARAGTPDDATTIANAYALELSRFVVKEQSELGVPVAQRLQLTVVAPARGAAQVSPTSKQRTTSGAGAGLAVGVATAGLVDVVRRRRS